MPKPIIIADKYIPFLNGLLDDVCDISYIEPEEFTNSRVKNADALIIRTRAICNESLLKNTNIKFIATATIGKDHIDKKYCNANNIEFTNAPGCNANSVVNYIHAALLNHFNDLKSKTIGIIGVGNVGGRVAKMASDLGMTVLLNDPPRALNENSNIFVDINTIQEQCDIITIHTPLNAGTKHIINSDFLTKCSNQPLIINAARGAVCNDQALLNYNGKIVLDCWNNEPNINLELLNKVSLATPHIAGYSLDGKANGTLMAAKAICSFFNLNKNLNIELPPKDNQTYNIKSESENLKFSPQKFEWFRNNYPIRRDIIEY